MSGDPVDRYDVEHMIRDACADALAAAQTRAVAAIGKALVAGQIPLQQIKKFQQAAECVSGAEHDVAIRSRDRRAGCAG